MRTNDIEEQFRQLPRHQFPPQLPPLYAGQKIQSGPYTITVTDEMVAQRERENLELYRAWLRRKEEEEDETEEEEYVGDFKDAAVRRIFIRKVFSLLTVQLLITVIITVIFIFVDAANKFMIVHNYLWLIALLVFIIAFCTTIYSVKVRRTVPFNYICLMLITLSLSYLVAFASVIYDIEVILLVVSLTTIVTFTITLVATFTKFDLTMRRGMLIIIGLVTVAFMFVLLFLIIFTEFIVLSMVIGFIGTLLFSLYLFFDIQVIMGGRRVEINPDEVIFATTQIYVDIILLYKYLLILVGFFHR